MLLLVEAEVVGMVEGCTEDDGNPDGGTRDEHRFLRVIRLKSVHRNILGNWKLGWRVRVVNLISLTSICTFLPAFSQVSLLDFVSHSEEDK